MIAGGCESGRMTSEVKCHSHHLVSVSSYQGYILSIRHPCISLVSPLHNCTFPPFSSCPLWKEVTVQFPPQGQELCSTSLRAEHRGLPFLSDLPQVFCVFDAILMRLPSFFFIKDFIYLFLDRGEGREKERETSMCGSLSRAPDWGPGL